MVAKFKMAAIISRGSSIGDVYMVIFILEGHFSQWEVISDLFQINTKHKKYKNSIIQYGVVYKMAEKAVKCQWVFHYQSF